MRVRLLKPRTCLRMIPPGLHEVVNVLAEIGIRQDTLEFLPRDRLQDGPRVMREVPQHRIQLQPQLIGSMIPRRTHIQGKLGQEMESLYVLGQKTILRVSNPCLFAHR